ncbi:MAG: U32 family peptidase [Salinivirgaceae bacterium]|nr:U32 family peptidase [Salinivirgaceae bacterium]
MNKPELLLPVGNIESFYAAISGGADAIYLGLKSFNARGRAANFTNFQLLLLMNEAHENKVKVYITLNTVIKNNELPELLDILWFLSKTKVDAVIIQDWGTFYLLKEYFPKLIIHASTQMANHNSVGANFSKKNGFSRVILARELSMPELVEIQKESKIETEIFVHGALCYSFSGMCLFSSYLGGSGANRGLCTQPCRRYYNIEGENKLVFSLKDNQLIDFIPKIAELGVSSLKIEGRIKSGEYVYQVAQAYKKVIENPANLPEAKKMLEMDMGREKTQWFMGKDVQEAVSDKPNTGLYIGKIEKVGNGTFSFYSSVEIEKGNRIRISANKDSEQISCKIDDFSKSEDGLTIVNYSNTDLKAGNEIFLAGLRNQKFPSKLKGESKNVSDKMPQHLKRDAISKVRRFKVDKNQLVFVRIDTVEWLRKMRLEDFDYLILNLPMRKWQEFKSDVPFIKNNSKKIWIELPKFISEKDIVFYKKLCADFKNKGFNQFFISHLSQIDLLAQGSIFSTNENVYAYNDAACQLLYAKGAKYVTSPLENEFENVLSGADRNQIIPMHFYPNLFYSRQPVSTGEKSFTDSKNFEFTREVRDGITIVLPDKPVSLLQYKTKLSGKGFFKYLIDLSFESPSKHTIKRLLNKLKYSEQDQPSTTFNFKKGLK